MIFTGLSIKSSVTFKHIFVEIKINYLICQTIPSEVQCEKERKRIL